MSEMSPEGRALLKSARNDLDASAEDCDRVGRALATRLGIAASEIAGATTATSANAAGASAAGAAAAGASTALAAGAQGSGASLLVAAKVLAATMLLAATGIGGETIYHATHEASVRSGAPAMSASPPEVRGGPRGVPSMSDGARAPTISGGAPPPTATTTRQDPAPEPMPRTAAPATARVRPVPARESEAETVRAGLSDAFEGTVGAETRLLRRADEELRNGHAARALELLDEHARTFPAGVLSEERSAERVTTLCELGRTDEARAEARRFLAAAADSPLAGAVGRSCGAPTDREGGARFP